MADQPDRQACGGPAVVAVIVRTADDVTDLRITDDRTLFLCERHNFAARGDA
jgi:hypothetical protein